MRKTLKTFVSITSKNSASVPGRESKLIWLSQHFGLVQAVDLTIYLILTFGLVQAVELTIDLIINILDWSRQWTSQLICLPTFWTGPSSGPHNWFAYQHFGLVQAVDLLQSRAGCCGNYEPKDWGSTDWGRGHQVPILVYSIFKTTFLFLTVFLNPAFLYEYTSD